MPFFVCNLPSFLNVLCNVDLEILINKNVKLTSNLGWSGPLTQFSGVSGRKFLFPPSSFTVLDLLNLLRRCISSLWAEKSKEEPITAWIWPHTSFNSSEQQQSVFSDPHWALLLSTCWFQCCWKRHVNFCKRANSFYTFEHHKRVKNNR